MCFVAMCDYHESVTTVHRDRHSDGQTDSGQSDPYVPLRFADNTEIAYFLKTQLVYI